MRSKLYEIKIFELCSKKLELMKQIHLFKKGFVIFLKGGRFRILLTLDFETTYPQVFKSTFCYSGGFFFNQVQTSSSSGTFRYLEGTLGVTCDTQNVQIFNSHLLIQKHLARAWRLNNFQSCFLIFSGLEQNYLQEIFQCPCSLDSIYQELFLMTKMIHK